MTDEKPQIATIISDETSTFVLWKNSNELNLLLMSSGALERSLAQRLALRTGAFSILFLVGVLLLFDVDLRSIVIAVLFGTAGNAAVHELFVLLRSVQYKRSRDDWLCTLQTRHQNDEEHH